MLMGDDWAAAAPLDIWMNEWSGVCCAAPRPRAEGNRRLEEQPQQRWGWVPTSDTKDPRHNGGPSRFVPRIKTEIQTTAESRGGGRSVTYEALGGSVMPEPGRLVIGRRHCCNLRSRTAQTASLSTSLHLPLPPRHALAEGGG
eukprot:GHVU01066423.1.p1 GENE.GHVU01066423.1~~GHVU01066423.1.p1  ORF type:complete len:143 (-),score=13.86 GHVU01066423.1:597-1025(-)